MRFLEISGNFHHIRSLFTTSFHYIFTTFSPHLHHNLHHMKFSRHLFTTFSLQIFTTEGQTDRDEQTPWGRTDRFHYIFTPQIYTTHFPPQIFTTNFDARSENLDFHDIFTTPVVKIQIFTTFSWHGPRSNIFSANISHGFSRQSGFSQHFHHARMFHNPMFQAKLHILFKPIICISVNS